MVFRQSPYIFTSFYIQKVVFLIHVFVMNMTNYKTNYQAKPLVDDILPIIKHVKYSYLSYDFFSNMKFNEGTYTT
jgi:hypothetical protein